MKSVRVDPLQPQRLAPLNRIEEIGGGSVTVAYQQQKRVAFLALAWKS